MVSNVPAENYEMLTVLCNGNYMNIKGHVKIVYDSNAPYIEYSNIGTHKLREITDKDGKQLVLWVGSKRLIKRKALEKYIDQSYSI